MAHTVYLTEKPSQAQDLAKVLGIKLRKTGYFELTNGDAVTYAFGHLLELVDPKEYDPSWGERWAWSQLPMIPSEFKLKVSHGKNEQVKVIKALLKDAKRCVIATDAGREGELIARSLLEHCRFKGAVERFWTSSLVASDIEKALKALKPGAATVPLYEAARARRNSDWVLGLSMTRAATLAASVRGDFFSVGRVQTPTLALVVRRDLAIRNFNADTYYELEATVQTDDGKTFKMWHAPDADKRIKERSEAERRRALAQDHFGPLRVIKTAGKESPALPYTLPALQRDANRVLGLTAAKTLAIAQALYEQKAITYPRTDCAYLASSQKGEVKETLDVIRKSFPDAVSQLERGGLELRASTFDDAKLTDHHAIVPSKLHVALSGVEAQVYAMICQRYLQTIAKDMLFDQTRVEADANGVLFKASGRAVMSAGWTALKTY